MRHPSRLDRDLGRKPWETKATHSRNWSPTLAPRFSVLTCSSTPVIREDHASYIHNWLQILKDEKRAVFTAASHASKAVDFLHGSQPPPVADLAER
jgi:antirestriction protein ArdC